MLPQDRSDPRDERPRDIVARLVTASEAPKNFKWRNSTVVRKRRSLEADLIKICDLVTLEEQLCTPLLTAPLWNPPGPERTSPVGTPSACFGSCSKHSY